MNQSLVFIFILLSLIYCSHSFNCGINSIQQHEIKQIDFGSNTTRRLTGQYEPIRIYVDEFQTVGSGIITNQLKTGTKTIIDNAIEMFQSLINVIRLEVLLKVEDFSSCGSAKPSNAIKTGVNADLFIFPIFDSTLPSDVDAAASFCFTEINNRPVVGQLLINPRFKLSATNSEKFLQMLIFHEVTHVLVFHDALYGFFIKENGEKYGQSATFKSTVNGSTRTKLATAKVLAAAKAHYNCDLIDGVELENQGGNGSAGSHWESRIMLGDYMVSTDYPEMVISEITLALFEDSGWYTVNRYTGGLFRFGKNRGCQFLNEKCIQNEKAISDDFCNIKKQSRCTAGRINKGTCNLQSQDEEIPSEYRYFKDKTMGGFKSADYCPIANESRNTDYYSMTSCKLGKKEYNLEKMGDDSVCVISSIKESSHKGMCFPIKCNDRTLSLTIGSVEYTCPREGGKVSNVPNYKGDLYCPDYNLICTGTVWCNDPIDCISKKSLFKTPVYDYTPQPSQIGGSFINIQKLLSIVLAILFFGIL